jgi:hypothetical protein
MGCPSTMPTLTAATAVWIGSVFNFPFTFIHSIA